MKNDYDFIKSLEGQEDLLNDINEDISKILDKYLPTTLGLNLAEMEIIKESNRRYLFEDLLAFTQKDPAAKGSPQYIRKNYKSFKAVMYYRLANTFFYHKSLDRYLREDLARGLSEDAKVETHIEIHPAAKIGRKFVIDHGVATVIGETCEIGEDCYLLQGVTLGARKIAYNNEGKRHPTLGNSVEIGAFTRILGPVMIGDNVEINPQCMIKQDIPSNYKVVIVNQLQLTTPKSPASYKLEIYGIVPERDNVISIYGYNFIKIPISVISLLDDKFQKIDELKCAVLSKDTNCIRIQILPQIKIDKEKISNKPKKVNIEIMNDQESIIIIESIGLNRAIENLKFGA